jgi:hypothetical protein
MEKYFVAAFFERPAEDKDVIILEKFDPADALKKNQLINIMGDKSKSDVERVIAEAEYHAMRGERSGYYACGPYTPGEILDKIPIDAEIIPDFKEM